MESLLFSFQMMYKSQFQKIDTYDWFCCPGSHILKTVLFSSIQFKSVGLTIVWEKKIQNIFQNVVFCYPQKKESHTSKQ